MNNKPFYVYILRSKMISRYYIGHAEDIDNRLSMHNKGYVKSTKAYRPWELIYTEEYETKNEAYKRELEIKSYKGGKAFKKLVSKCEPGQTATASGRGAAAAA